jgi:hypothetical protein
MERSILNPHLARSRSGSRALSLSLSLALALSRSRSLGAEHGLNQKPKPQTLNLKTLNPTPGARCGTRRALTARD